MKKNAQYEINPIDKTITLTKKFLKEASIMGTPEYKELKKLEKDNPGFTLKERKITQKVTKVTYDELSFAVMKSIIEDVYKSDANTKATKIAEFNAVKDFYSANKATKYGHVKSWFVQNYKQAYLDRYDNQNMKKTA